MIGDYLIPILSATIGASLAAVVCCCVRDSRLDDLRRELEARMANGDQIQADWDNRLKARVQRLERSDREVRLRLMGQNAQLATLADALEDLQAAHDGMGEAIFCGADAATDVPTDNHLIPLLGVHPGGKGA